MSTNGYAFVRLSVTVGVAASLTSAQVLGFNPRFAPGDASNQAAVARLSDLRETSACPCIDHALLQVSLFLLKRPSSPAGGLRR
jgi:hypothetical protein